MSRYWLARCKSILIAVAGIRSFFSKEVHGRLHLILAVIAIAISLICRLNSLEWLFILLSLTLVFISEMFNTCIERIMDYINKDYDPRIKIIKDIAAGAVLVAAIFAIIVAAVILLPKLFDLFF
jgi:diacylglycerol kinase